MRYAIISDLHANRQALKAVLTDAGSSGVDQIICLGDIIGYGPCPAEVLELAYANVAYFLLGNHDAVVAGIMSPDCFNDNARRLIEWTCSNLDAKAAKFFLGNPLLLTGDNFRCAHAEFEDPRRFGYILDSDSALKSFRITNEQLLFVGHSHVPGIFVIGESGHPHWMRPRDFATEPVKRYIVNVGSVGQPRDDDCRASYCIYDDETRGVSFRRIPFDIDAYRADLRKRSLPESSSYFLKIADKLPAESIRDIIDFSPLSPEAALKLENTAHDLRKEVEKLRISRRNLIIAIVILLTLAISLGFAVFFKRSSIERAVSESSAARTIVVKAKREIIPPILRAPPVGPELVSMPRFRGKVSDETPLINWTIVMSREAGQSVSVETEKDSKGDEFTIFRIKSAKPAPLTIKYLPAKVGKGMRFTASAQFKKMDLRAGFIELRLVERVKDGSVKTILRREPRNFASLAKWIKTSITNKTREPLADDGELFWCLRCEFVGEMLVRKCHLERKQ